MKNVRRSTIQSFLDNVFCSESISYEKPTTLMLTLNIDWEGKVSQIYFKVLLFITYHLSVMK